MRLINTLRKHLKQANNRVSRLPSCKKKNLYLQCRTLERKYKLDSLGRRAGVCAREGEKNPREQYGVTKGAPSICECQPCLSRARSALESGVIFAIFRHRGHGGNVVKANSDKFQSWETYGAAVESGCSVFFESRFCFVTQVLCTCENKLK